MGDLGAGAGAILNHPITKLFPEAFVKSVEAHRQARVPLPHAIPAGGTYDWGERQAIPFFTPGSLICEIEPLTLDRRRFNREVALRELTEVFNCTQSLNELLATACRQFSHYLGTDRTVVYRLAPNGSGVIASEHLAAPLPSLLGLHFRPDDFPEEAHHLFADESVLTGTSTYREGIGIVGDPGDAAAIIRYRLGCRMPYRAFTDFLVESGIEGIISVALRVDGKLWGVIFGHCIEPVRYDYQLRAFAHVFGSLLSQSIAFRNRSNVSRRIPKTKAVNSKLKDRVAGALDLVDGLTKGTPTLLDAIANTTGAFVRIEDSYTALGTTPDRREVQRLLDWVAQTDWQGDIFASANLAVDYPSAEKLRGVAAGCLLAPLNRRRTDWIGWFRPERIEQVFFGSLSQSDRGGDSPRYLPSAETKRGFSRPWKPKQLRAARDIQSFIRDVIMERYSQLRQMNRQLRMAYKEMEDFSYTVSHDLRAPLRGIDGFAEILLEEYAGDLGPDGRELIQTIQKNAAQMNEFITDILELSRAGRAKLIVNELSVSELVRAALTEMAPGTELHSAVTVAPGLPPIRGDQYQLRTVFRHLLSNALKYAKSEESRRIEVGYRPDRSLPSEGEFFVADNGIGIEVQHHDRVFGMFNRLVTKEQYAGNGVGLAITKRIIQNHGGDIRIESQPGKGTTLFFYTHPVVE
jgi:light-regulated signal transduction histidine kinase (bacteriophytochrome)